MKGIKMFFKKKSKTDEVPVENYLLAARLADEVGDRELSNIFANIAILKIKTSLIENSTAPR
jgi:uncharacterized protein HemY